MKVKTSPVAKTPALIDESLLFDVKQSGSWDVAWLSLEYKGAPMLVIIIEEYELHCLNSNKIYIYIYMISVFKVRIGCSFNS